MKSAHMCGCMCVTAAIKLFVHFFPQAQWPSLLHTRIWGNLPKTSSVKALVSEEIYLTCICNCCSLLLSYWSCLGTNYGAGLIFRECFVCSVLQVSIVLLASAKRLFFTALRRNIYVFLKYPNFFSTGYGILKLDVKTKSQSGVVSITVVTGCV